MYLAWKPLNEDEIAKKNDLNFLWDFQIQTDKQAMANQQNIAAMV